MVRSTQSLKIAGLRSRWRSPIRGPWLTSVFGAVLLVGIPIEFVTGLISYAAYNPRLAGNDTTPQHGILSFYLFNWVTSPSWIYRVSQGTHVLLGLVLVPVLLAKLWSVIPRLFEWPPLRSAAHLLERASLVLLVGGAVFQFATGILNIDYDYSFRFSFYNGHFYGAWAFIAGFAVHVILKFGRMWRALRSRSFRAELSTSVAETVPEPIPVEDRIDAAGRGDSVDGVDSLVPAQPGPATISRRGVLALVGGSSAAVFLLTAGQSIPALRGMSLLSPRTRSYGSGPNAFQVNRTAAVAGISSEETGPDWRLALIGPDGQSVRLNRTQLLSMDLITAQLPIACVEGWSTVQRWTGVRLTDLAGAVGVKHPTGAHVESLERHGAFARASLSGEQVRAAQSLLALHVNGADLSPDHGYPARVIVPAAPGVHNTKWVARITFSGSR